MLQLRIHSQENLQDLFFSSKVTSAISNNFCVKLGVCCCKSVTVFSFIKSSNSNIVVYAVTSKGDFALRISLFKDILVDDLTLSNSNACNLALNNSSCLALTAYVSFLCSLFLMFSSRRLTPSAVFLSRVYSPNSSNIAL